MSGDTLAITILLASFFIMVFLRFPIAYAVALSSVLCLLSQGLPLTTICLQFDGGAVLYHHGLSDGLRRHFREADSAGQLLCGVDAGRHGDG